MDFRADSYHESCLLEDLDRIYEAGVIDAVLALAVVGLQASKAYRQEVIIRNVCLNGSLI